MALYVVTGPPAAGKTTWVTTRATAGDVVIDLDRLASALTAPGADFHSGGRAVRRVAHAARRGAVHTALGMSKDVDVYIIHTDPPPEAMARYAEHGAQVVTVDPGRDVVLARCAEQRSATATRAAERWYDTPRDIRPDHTSGSRAW